jgi:hypothetical protein
MASTIPSYFDPRAHETSASHIEPYVYMHDDIHALLLRKKIAKT